jgi:UDP:flavonoid glycosyltransferase YjiC (YdhE family)
MRDAHLVVTSSFSLVARLAVEKLGLPSVSLLLSPLTFFSSEEEIHLMEAPWLTKVHRIFGPTGVKLILNLGRLQSKWQTRRISQYRRQLGLPPVKGDEMLDGPLRADWIAALYTPLLGPLPIDAPQNSFIAGFTFYDSEFGGPSLLSKSLSDFLENGDAPLVFTLGSLAVYAAGDFYETAVEIAKRMSKRAVLLVGPQAEAWLKSLASDDVFVAGYAPHSMVFPYAAAIIHHGGIGTVAQALRVGRPQLICPLYGDQADNAERLARLGVAKRLDLKTFTADGAIKTLTSLIGDTSIADRAAQLAPQVTKEDGAGIVAAKIAALLS